MQQSNKTIQTKKRGRYIDIFICYSEMDDFGKEETRRILFDSVLPYQLDITLKQANNLNR